MFFIYNFFKSYWEEQKSFEFLMNKFAFLKIKTRELRGPKVVLLTSLDFALSFSLVSIDFPEIELKYHFMRLKLLGEMNISEYQFRKFWTRINYCLEYQVLSYLLREKWKLFKERKEFSRTKEFRERKEEKS